MEGQRGQRIRAGVATGMALVATILVGACGGSDDDPGPPVPSDGLAGRVTVDGSSTVAPLTRRAAAAFTRGNPNLEIQVGISGTGGGFDLFCAGRIDIADASRPISADERRRCAAKGIEYTALRVASDGITLVTRRGAAVGTDCLTREQLVRIWGPGSPVARWRDIDRTWRDVKITLAGADAKSGTYDFFNEAVLGEDRAGEVITPRQDYAASEDDNTTALLAQTAAAPLAYFGYSYFERHQRHVSDFALDWGEGCIRPSAKSITDGSYPLARPLFIYVANTALTRPEVTAFARFYLTRAVELARSERFVPAPEPALREALGRLGT